MACDENLRDVLQRTVINCDARGFQVVVTELEETERAHWEQKEKGESLEPACVHGIS